MIEISETAAAAVRQSEEAARRFNPDARIRLRSDGGGVRFELTERPEDTDVPVDCGGATLYVEAGLGGRLDTGEHNAPVLRPE
jgi:Fe-S cluster assembly iron-binding protein IscA